MVKLCGCYCPHYYHDILFLVFGYCRCSFSSSCGCCVVVVVIRVVRVVAGRCGHLVVLVMVLLALHVFPTVDVLATR